MGRKLRYIPDGGALVEVTCRTLHGRLLLRPSPELNDITARLLGRAQRLYPVDIVVFQALSNHYHALLFVKSAKRLAEFAGYLNSNLAREVARLTGWTGKIWERRYQAIPVSGEEEAQVGRLKYVLSHGVKENLVARLREWPGLHCIRQLADGERSYPGGWHPSPRPSALPAGSRTCSPRTISSWERVSCAIA
jgi:REP element-mobilizing transposase RayT